MRRICGLSPKLAAETCLFFWRKTFRVKESAKETKILSRAREFKIRLGDIWLHAWKWGQSSKSVLLVHGFSGRGSQLSGYVIPLIQAGYQVYTFDAPAHGRSPGQSTDIIEFSDSIVEILGVIGPVEAIISHSFGCAATGVALRQGIQVEKLVFLAPPSDLIGVSLQFGKSRGIPEGIIYEMNRLIEKRYGFQLEDLSLQDVAQDINLPVFIAHDTEDDEVDISQSRSLEKAWESSKLLETQGLGHYRIMWSPKVIAEVIPFIEKKVRKKSVLKKAT